MSTLTVTRSIRWDSWQLTDEADRRFRRIVVLVAIPVALLAVAMQIWDFRTPKAEVKEFETPQYVQLLPEKPPLPPAEKPAEPKPEAKPEAKAPKPEVKPEKKIQPEVKPEKSAREIAQKSGVLALSDQLADLRDKNLTPIDQPQTLQTAISSKGGVGPSSGGADAVAASAAKGSGGIGDKAVATAESSGGLGTRSTGSVRSPLGFGTDKSRGGSGTGIGNGRTLNEIKQTFDRNAGPFYAIFNRASRENANIGRGTIRVKIVIAPSGAVTACTLVSSTYNDPEFERKVVERVKLLNFGAKNVPEFTTEYPIYFIPQ